MIAPMKRVHVALLASEKREGLAALRKLGVVHLEPVTGSGEAHWAALAKVAEIDRTLGLLSSYKPAGQAPALDAGAALGEARRLNALHDESMRLQEELTTLSKERERIEGWGDFEPSALTFLAERGIRLRIYECHGAVLPELPESVDRIRLFAPKGRARFATVNAGHTVSLPQELQEFEPPRTSLSEISETIARATGRVAEIKAELAGSAGLAASLKKARLRYAQELAFETFASGIGAAGPVAYLSGFAPALDVGRLVEESKTRGWALVADEPSDEEFPPTKIENSSIVRMIDPVFAFLGTVPNYREYDISASFLAFFALYFAMIFGDGAYGLILFAVGAFAAIRATTAGRRIADGVRLVLLLSATTLAWGAATGSWFSLPMDGLPGVLRAITIPAIRNDNPDSATNVKIFCFLLGVAQLLLAHAKNLKRDFPQPKFLSQIGALAVVVGMYTAVLNLVIDARRFPIPPWALWLIGGGFILMFIFGNWEGTILKSLLAGLKGIIPNFLGLVNFFADIVSYIRLWAVGLAGVAISQTVNKIAGDLFSSAAGILFGVLLLLVGHGLNFALSLLSVVVHGIRLNMLEYSGHLGMEWSGYPYDPFRESVRAEIDG